MLGRLTAELNAAPPAKAPVKVLREISAMLLLYFVCGRKFSITQISWFPLIPESNAIRRPSG